MEAVKGSNDCYDCPFRKDHYSPKGYWEYCGHRAAPKTNHSNIIASYRDSAPAWCPLRD